MKSKKFTALVCSLFVGVGAIHVSSHAAGSEDIYSDSITRQLGSAEVPKSFDSNAREESSAINSSVTLAENTNAANSDAALEPLAIDSVDQADRVDEPAKVVKSHGRKANKAKAVAKKHSKKKKKKKKHAV